MSKIWSIGSKQDDLVYLVAAPNWETALKLVETLSGPMNPAARKIVELPGIPEGYHLSADGTPGFLVEDF